MYETPSRLSDLTASILKQPRGSDFAKFAWLLLENRGDLFSVVDKAARFAQIAPNVSRVVKAAVSALGTTDDGFAADSSWRSMSNEFVALVSERTIFGRLREQMRRVPFNTRTLVEQTPADATWMGEGRPKPMSALSLDTVHIPPAKIVALCVFTQELVETWSPAAERSILDSIVASVAKFADRAFLDPTAAAVVGINPQSITFGITPTVSSGSTAAQVVSDLREMLGRMVNTGSDLSSVSIVLHPTSALYMSGLLTTGGNLMFPDLGATGGQVWKIPTLTSRACGDWNSPTERIIVAIDSRSILYADDNKVLIDASREASLQFVSDPVENSTALISLWATNHTALRVERFMSWQRATDSAVEIISNVMY